MEVIVIEVLLVVQVVMVEDLDLVKVPQQQRVAQVGQVKEEDILRLKKVVNQV